MGFGSAHPGLVRGLAQAWFHSVQPYGSRLWVGLGWQLNICIGAGLATLTNQGLANHCPPFLEPKYCFDAFSMGGERVSILFIKIWSESLEPLLPAQGSVQERSLATTALREVEGRGLESEGTAETGGGREGRGGETGESDEWRGSSRRPAER